MTKVQPRSHLRGRVLFILNITEGELSSEAIHARLLTSDVAAPCAGLLVLQTANWVHLHHCY